MSDGFAGFNLMDMETGWNNILLDRIEYDPKAGAIRLNCKTKRTGSLATGYIRSEDPDLLEKIKIALEDMKGKSINEIRGAKIG